MIITLCIDNFYSASRITPLPSINDQDLMINIPEDVGGNPPNYLALWSRSSLVSFHHTINAYYINANIFYTQVSLASVTFSEKVFPPAPPPITAWYLGSLTERAHNVMGDVYALDNKTLLLSGFHFDGNAPGIYS